LLFAETELLQYFHISLKKLDSMLLDIMEAAAEDQVSAKRMLNSSK
jgi:hypothetical protein